MEGERVGSGTTLDGGAGGYHHGGDDHEVGVGGGDGGVFHGDEFWLGSDSKRKRYTFQLLFHQCIF